jgi:hypothetical protein
MIQNGRIKISILPPNPFPIIKFLGLAEILKFVTSGWETVTLQFTYGKYISEWYPNGHAFYVLPKMFSLYSVT